MTDLGSAWSEAAAEVVTGAGAVLAGAMAFLLLFWELVVLRLLDLWEVNLPLGSVLVLVPAAKVVLVPADLVILAFFLEA